MCQALDVMVSQSLTPVVASVWAWAPGRVSSDIHLTGPGGEWGSLLLTFSPGSRGVRM